MIYFICQTVKQSIHLTNPTALTLEAKTPDSSERGASGRQRVRRREERVACAAGCERASIGRRRSERRQRQTSSERTNALLPFDIHMAYNYVAADLLIQEINTRSCQQMKDKHVARTINAAQVRFQTILLDKFTVADRSVALLPKKLPNF